MKDLVIELILIAMIAMPAIADSLQPARAIHNNRLCSRRKLRGGGA